MNFNCNDIIFIYFLSNFVNMLLYYRCLLFLILPIWSYKHFLICLCQFCMTKHTLHLPVVMKFTLHYHQRKISQLLLTCGGGPHEIHTILQYLDCCDSLSYGLLQRSHWWYYFTCITMHLITSWVILLCRLEVAHCNKVKLYNDNLNILHSVNNHRMCKELWLYES